MTNRDSAAAERTIVVERHLRLTQRSCVTCGTVFLGWGRGKFCSTACRRKADYDRHAEERRGKRMERYRRGKKQPKE